MDWKLKRGTWRPRLTELVAANQPEVVKNITSKAYALVGPKEHTLPDAKHIKEAVAILSTLKVRRPDLGAGRLAKTEL